MKSKLRYIFTIITLCLAIISIIIAGLSASIIAVPGLVAFLMAATAISLGLMFYFGNETGSKWYIIIYVVCAGYALYKITQGVMQIMQAAGFQF